MPSSAPIGVFFNEQLDELGSALVVIDWNADDDPALL
jgi:hypothetical protein